MHTNWLVRLVLAIGLLTLASNGAYAEEFTANCTGFEEVGGLNADTGPILSAGTANLDVKLDRRARTLTYALTYSDLSAAVTQAHIHFGRAHTAGSVLAFLCTNLDNGPAGTPGCPPYGGTVSGTITAADIIGIPWQNVDHGDFEAIETILSSDSAYANIHTVKFPTGEIRGQLRRGH